MFKTLVKGFIVGSSMMIPGVSGGSMAMILGEYDRLIAAIPSLFSRKTFKSSLVYLLLFMIAALAGILIVARPLEIIINRYSLIIMYLFLGAVCGTIPMMVKKAHAEGFDIPSAIYIIIGIALVFSVELIPEGIFNPTLDASFSDILIQVLGGVLVSVGLVLPGISTSYLLLVLGLYEPIISALSNNEFISLIPIVAGLLAGILALTKALQIAMDRYPKITYMMILGFLLGSIKEIYPGLPSSWDILVALILFSLGFAVVYKLSLFEEEDEKKQKTC